MPRYDTIIVGAGSAGSVLAARLTENPNHRVLLIEAGPDGTSSGVDGPNFFAARNEPGRIWDDLVVRHTRAQTPRHYNRGRGVGGSAAVNALLNLPGDPADYNAWAAAGATGWAFTDVRNTLASVMATSATTQPRAFERHIAKAAGMIGLSASDQLHVPGALGIGPAPLALRNGRRHSTVSTHLQPARTRPNLHVRCEALVDRVLLHNNSVLGVRLATGEEIQSARTILCAGAIHSPAILLRSGTDLRGIGCGLQDHAGARVVFTLPEAARATTTNISAVSIVGRFSSGLDPAGSDLQLLPMGLLGPDEAGLAMGMIMVALMRPISRGTLTLATPDPTVHPHVDLGLLNDEYDLIRLRIGMRMLLRLTGILLDKGAAQAAYIDSTGTTAGALTDDAALDRWLLAETGDYVHACGTCRMGGADDPDAVVDPLLRVRGTQGLWVVDASVMPVIPAANTHVPTVMIAERASTWLAAPA